MKKLILSILAASAGMASLTSCSGEEVVIPDNPESPTAVYTSTDKIIYEANPRMYSAQNGLKAIYDQLADIRDYGTDILWIMPATEPGIDAKSIGSPYCVKNYNAIDPKLGNMDDFKNIVTKSHSLGMSVILDWVANHTSWDNAWITYHPDWYVQNAKGEIQSPSGWTDVAELNYDNKDMRAAMIEAMRKWITDTGIDGFRLDNTEGVPDDFWKECIASLRKTKQDLFILAETPKANAFDYGADMIYGWAFADELAGVFTAKNNATQLINQVNEEIAKTTDGDLTRIMRYSLNHDTASENAIANLFVNDKGAEAAYALALFMGGTPMFYTAQLTDYNGKASFFTYHQANFNNDKIAAIKKLNAIFKNTSEVRKGDISVFYSGKAITMQHTLNDKALLIMVNPTASAISAKTPIALAGGKVQDLITNVETTLPDAVSLDPYQYVIYSK